eukprot:m.17653 g.17653  ORF g.17653 m.17653 type:complete len:438 (+) comp11274_c0_seq2:434-1747(+)
MEREHSLHVTVQRVLRQAASRLAELEKGPSSSNVGATGWQASPSKSPLMMRTNQVEDSLLASMHWCIDALDDRIVTSGSASPRKRRDSSMQIAVQEAEIREGALRLNDGDGGLVGDWMVNTYTEDDKTAAKAQEAFLQVKTHDVFSNGRLRSKSLPSATAFEFSTNPVPHRSFTDEDDESSDVDVDSGHGQITPSQRTTKEVITTSPASAVQLSKRRWSENETRRSQSTAGIQHSQRGHDRRAHLLLSKSTESDMVGKMVFGFNENNSGRTSTASTIGDLTATEVPFGQITRDTLEEETKSPEDDINSSLGRYRMTAQEEVGNATISPLDEDTDTDMATASTPSGEDADSGAALCDLVEPSVIHRDPTMDTAAQRQQVTVHSHSETGQRQRHITDKYPRACVNTPNPSPKHSHTCEASHTAVLHSETEKRQVGLCVG